MDLIDAGVLFFSLLGVAALLGVVSCWASVGLLRIVPGFGPALRVTQVARFSGRPAAAVVAVTTLCGSLFMSEVAHYVPCELCWYQRIAAWPLAALCVVGALRRDTKVWTYTLPLCGVGAAVSLWHLAIERIPALSESVSCGTEASCTVRWVWQFGFVSIPLLALICFAAVATSTFMARHHGDGRCARRRTAVAVP